MTVDDLSIDPCRAAASAGLRHVSDDEPGYTRRRRGKGFSYNGPSGRLVRDPATRERLAALAIPPAWRDVWICPHPSGHILATGRDEKERKQYIYHPHWHEVRNATKFHRLPLFGAALPQLRERVAADLRRRGLPREKVLATAVRLLDATGLRVGSERYRRQNGSYGLTTLRRRHVDVDGRTIRLSFRGKGGKMQEVEVNDRRLARVVSDCQEIPGQNLFQYLDEDGDRCAVESDDVNEYLREAAGEGFTAKDFRTWTGTLLALRALCDHGPCGDDEKPDTVVLKAVDAVAEELNNTRAVCRSFYIHPRLLDGYGEGWLLEAAEPFPAKKPREGLTGEEESLLAVLEALPEDDSEGG